MPSSDTQTNETTNDMPTAECPHCGKSFHQDDYWTIEQGDTLECPKCEQEIYVTCVDYTMLVTLSTHKEGD